MPTVSGMKISSFFRIRNNVKIIAMKKKSSLLLFFFLAFLAWDSATAAPKSKKKTSAKKETVKKEIEKPKTKSFESKMNQEVLPADLGDSRFHRFNLNTILGMNIVQGSGLVSGMQFGYAPMTSTSLYIG